MSKVHTFIKYFIVYDLSYAKKKLDLFKQWTNKH